MTPYERLEKAWVEAGYPREYIPKQQFLKVAEPVAEAFAAGDPDFLKTGWARARVDYPFAPAHPRYQAMLEAYRRLADKGE
ncbi:MAG: hypothetical protein ACOY93_02535 [Bacillota bacterium]